MFELIIWSNAEFRVRLREVLAELGRREGDWK